MRRALFLLLCVTACFSKPEYTGSGGGNPDANGDGARDGASDGASDGPPGACGIVDSFEPPDQPPCGTWGDHMGMATAIRSGGQIRFNAPAGQIGFCESKLAHTFGGGAMIHVGSITPSGMQGDLVFMEIDTQNGRLRLQQTQVDSFGTLMPVLQMHAANGGVLAEYGYDASTTDWWQLRSYTDRIEAQYSADGTGWTTFGMFDVTDATLPTKIRIGAQGFGDTGEFTVTQIRVCP